MRHLMMPTWPAACPRGRHFALSAAGITNIFATGGLSSRRTARKDTAGADAPRAALVLGLAYIFVGDCSRSVLVASHRHFATTHARRGADIEDHRRYAIFRKRYSPTP